MIPGRADATPALAPITYPSTRLADVKDLKVDVAVQIQYPDQDSPGVIVKLGRRVEGGVGSDGDIVAFSTLCPHKAIRSATSSPTRRSTAQATTRASTARREASRSGATPRKTCRSFGCASPAMATSSPT